jgi:superfamily I DNA/RNA helicase
MEYVCELYHPTILPLKTNCRNTQPIASRTAALTITHAAKNLKLSGPKVVTKTYNSNSDFISSFTKELLSLLSSGVSAKDIVVLSRYKKENSNLSKVKSICNLTIVEQSGIKSFKARALNYYTVQSFKGLESKIVFYIDVDGFKTIEDRMLNYVAMSRACVSLYLFYNEAKREEYQDTLDKGTDLLG